MMTKFYWLLILLSNGLLAQAQRPYKVTGRVTAGADHQPLSAVDIRNTKGSKIQSGENGMFSMDLSTPDTMYITHPGYNKRMFPVTEATASLGDIQLEEIPSMLEEVQVSTGYQTLPKERATGSFELINNQRLNEQVSPDIMSKLEGTSSILFDKNSSRPSMTIRGFSSLTKSIMSPLVIMDNFPYEGDIDNINPNDVESVTLLKDAAASSIWGARAGNGVIVITTKKAKEGKPLTIDFNSNVTLVAKPDLYSVKQMSSGIAT